MPVHGHLPDTTLDNVAHNLAEVSERLSTHGSDAELRGMTRATDFIRTRAPFPRLNR